MTLTCRDPCLGSTNEAKTNSDAQSSCLWALPLPGLPINSRSSRTSVGSLKVQSSVTLTPSLFIFRHLKEQRNDCFGGLTGWLTLFILYICIFICPRSVFEGASGMLSGLDLKRWPPSASSHMPFQFVCRSIGWIRSS